MRFSEQTYRKAPQKPPSSVNVNALNPSTVHVTWRYVQPTLEEEPLLGFKVSMGKLLLYQNFQLLNGVSKPN